MPDCFEKFAQNVPGRYYVTKACIGCTLCSEIAPDNFKENGDAESAVDNNYVCKQPETEAEESACREAMESCPANAIGDDGDQ